MDMEQTPINYHYSLEHNSDGYGAGPLNHHYPLTSIQIDMEMDKG